MIGPDGSKYGPADIDKLNQWIKEGRIHSSTELEEEDSGTRRPAQELSELVFDLPPQAPATGSQQPTVPPWGNPSQPPQDYYPPGGQPYDPNVGTTEVTWAWVLGILGFLCCPIIGPAIGIALAQTAKNKGNPSAQAPLILCIVALVLGCCGGGGRWLSMGGMPGHHF